MKCEDEDGLADCYVVVKFDDFDEKTPVVKNTCSPVWNIDYKFDVEKGGNI